MSADGIPSLQICLESREAQLGLNRPRPLRPQPLKLRGQPFAPLGPTRVLQPPLQRNQPRTKIGFPEKSQHRPR